MSAIDKKKRKTGKGDPVMESGLDEATASAVERYRRAVNYLAAAQIYLKDNPLLEEPLSPMHIKDRLLGHWGTAPGINLMYAHLNRLIINTDAAILLITGPGHGAAANLANMYLEGTLSEYFPDLTRDRAGLARFLKSFSWPDAFPSHLYPGYPGVIHEGGELGYALSTAFGAALDNPDLIVACIVGDGEAETGPTAGAWHSNKFLNPATDFRHHGRLRAQRPVHRARIPGQDRGVQRPDRFRHGPGDGVGLRRDPGAAEERARREARGTPPLADADRPYAQRLDRAQGDRRQEDGRLLPVPPGPGKGST
jgi:hypothetical protein